MNIPADLLPEHLFWVAWGLWAAAVGLALRKARWRDLLAPSRFNLYLGMIVLLTLVWSLRAGVRPGLELHFVGAAVFTLCFDAPLAFLGLNLVLAGVTLNGAADAFAFGMNALLVAAPGVLVSRAMLNFAERVLPRQVFVYVFVNGFFGGGLAVLAVGIGATLILGFAGIYPLDYLLDEYLPYYLLLGFSEAWLSGMVVTLCVIYRPHWIASFDDARYLNDKPNKK